MVHVLSSESFFKIYCKEAVYIEVVGDVATTCLSWKQVCLQTSQRFISKWKFHSEKVTKDVWNSENNLYVTDKFSACLTTIKLLGTHQASPAHCANDALYNLNQIFFFRRRLHAGNSVLRLFYFKLYYLETSSSA